MKHLILLLLLFSNLAGASESDLRFVTLNYSHHFNKESSPNEKHNGIGFEYKDFGYLQYTNSFNNKSNFLYITKPIKNFNNFSFNIGVVDGYPNRNIIGGLSYRVGIVNIITNPYLIAIGLKIDLK